MAMAFAEWERRYREEPARFMAESARAAETCESYGEACAAYFVTILAEVTLGVSFR